MKSNTVQLRYIVGKEFTRKQYGIDVIRGTLTRNIALQFGDVRDEIMAAFGDEIPLTAGKT